MPRFQPALLFVFWFAITFFCLPANAQSVYAPLNRDYEHLIERYEIKYGKFADGLHSHVKPYERKGIMQLVDSVTNTHNFLSERDKFNLTYLQNDNWEWATDTSGNISKTPIFKKLYQKKSDFFSFRNPDFDVHLNPVLYFSYGSERNSDTRPYINSRGVEMRGMVDNKVGFYAFLTENQVAFPGYVRERIAADNALPNEGFFKPYKTSATDFLTARGYVTFNITRHIQTQFGYDKNFIGNGFRSMILSDYASNYIFLKLSTQVWKIKYTNIFAQMVAGTPTVLAGGNPYPPKYFTFHHLSMNLSKNLNIGLFEAIVFGRDNATFDFSYLNPIIFYRSIEQQDGSPDNALLGLDAKYNFMQHFSIYGQLVIDELLVSNLRAGKGSWTNKQAGQFGIKYIDAFGLHNLDLQAELNIARPYTYTHVSNTTNYTHFNQPLAHPLGSNFKEVVGIVRYQATNRLSFKGRLTYSQQGLDSSKTAFSYGGDILRSYNNRPSTAGGLFIDDGYKIGSGVKTTLLYLDFTASYQLKQNLFVDFRQIIRRLDSAIPSRNENTSVTTLSIRLNIAPREQVQ